MTNALFTDEENEWLDKELGVHLLIKVHPVYKHYCVITQSPNDGTAFKNKTQWRLDKLKEITKHNHPIAKKLLDYIATFKIHRPTGYEFWYEL